MSLLVVLAACTSKSDDHPPVVDSGPPTDTTSPPTVHPPPEGEPALYFVGDRPKNVLMLSIDTTRRDHFGASTVTGTNYTPFLGGLASGGVWLDDHQQCSNWTYASTSCTLNGRYHEENGFIPQLSASGQAPLPEGQLTLAQRLQDQGYYTILVSSNGWLGPRWNNDQGYVEAPEPTTSNATMLLQDGQARLEGALANGADRWMLHVHFVEPHPPYNPPEAYRGEEALLPPLPEDIDLDTQTGHYAVTNQWGQMTPSEQALLIQHLQARYHGELQYLDQQLADYWVTLQQAGLLEDTLVVVWTDHGEQFWEHGNQSHAYFLAAEENDGVLFFWSANLPPRLWTRPTHAVDLAPTVLDALGYPPDPADTWFSGYTLGTAPDERPRFGMSVARLGPVQSVTSDGWKLTFNFAGVVRLYDRNTDRYELVDLYPSDPDNEHVLPLWRQLLPRIQMLSALVPERPLIWPEGLPTE